MHAIPSCCTGALHTCGHSVSTNRRAGCGALPEVLEEPLCSGSSKAQKTTRGGLKLKALLGRFHYQTLKLDAFKLVPGLSLVRFVVEKFYTFLYGRQSGVVHTTGYY